MSSCLLLLYIPVARDDVGGGLLGKVVLLPVVVDVVAAALLVVVVIVALRVDVIVSYSLNVHRPVMLTLLLTCHN